MLPFSAVVYVSRVSRCLRSARLTCSCVYEQPENQHLFFSSPLLVLAAHLRTQPNEQRVVIGGERPALDKNWPDGLSKLLAYAWHSDHNKRPTASQLVVALREIRAQLPAPRGSFRKRPSATTNVSRRRHSWTGGTSMSSLLRGAVEQRPGSTVQGSHIVDIVPGVGHHHDTSARPTKATEEARDLAAAAAPAAGGEKSESHPSVSKPRKNFAMLRQDSLPTLKPSTSSSSSRRTSWYKLRKKSSSTSATSAEEDCRRDSNPRPTESGNIIATSAIPSLSTAVGSILKTDDARDNDRGQHAPEEASDFAGSVRGTGRCAFHQGLVDEREVIVNTLAFEAKEQMASDPGRASSATIEFVAQSQKALEATSFTRGREGTASDVPGNISNLSNISIAIDASGTAQDVSGRSSRRSNSVIKLWPSASPYPAEKPDATPISKGGCGESIGGSIGATNGIEGTVALTVSG